MGTRHHVVILGAGFGGIAAVRELRRAGAIGHGCRVTVIDRSSCHVFTPLLYEMATGFIEHENVGSERLLERGVAIANAPLLARYGAGFVEGEVEGVDWARREVLVRGSAPAAFDSLVIALGSQTNYYDIEGMRDRAYPMKTLRDADRLRQRIRDTLRRAEEGLERKIDIVIGGGGTTGVELAAELTMFLRRHLVRGCLKPEDFQISVVEATSRLLSSLDPRISARAADRLAHLGVRVYLDTCVKRLRKGSAVIAPRPLKQGETVEQLVCDFRQEAERTIDADLLVWTGGIRGAAALGAFAIGLDPRGGRIPVGATLEVAKKEGVYAIGDSALCIDPKTGAPAPWTAQAAILMGTTVGATIAAKLRGGGAERYPFPVFPFVVPLGGKNAVTKIGNVVFGGFSGWLMKELASLRYFLRILPPFQAIRLWWQGEVMYGKND